MCWIASVCFCTTENCWAKPSTVSPNSPAWEMGASIKRTLSTSFISARLSQRWCSTRVDIAFLMDRTVIRRPSTSGRNYPQCICFSALAWWTCRITMACKAEAAWRPWERSSAYSFGWKTWMIGWRSGGILRVQVHRNRSLHLENVHVLIPGGPAIRVVRTEEGDEQLLALKGSVHTWPGWELVRSGEWG